MTGKHILVVGAGNDPYVLGALNMIKELHGTTEVRYADSIPNDTQEPQPECVVVINDTSCPINTFEVMEFKKSCELREPMNRKERRHGFIDNNEPWRRERRK